MAAVINNKNLLIVSYKFELVALIYNHYSSIMEKQREKCYKTKNHYAIIHTLCYFNGA